MKTKFVIVRHGESLGNAKRIILGHTDWDITDLGKRQAEVTTEALADRHFDAVYSSDLCRAYNTVLPAATSRGLAVIPEQGLREQFVGDWEGCPVNELIEQYGELYTVNWRHHFGTFRAPGGESIPELGRRIENTLAKIAKENPGKSILIGTHAAAIRAFWGRINHIAPEDLNDAFPFPTNASYSEVEFDDGLFTPISYSCDAHLSGMITAFKS